MGSLDLENLLSIPLFFLFKLDHSKSKMSFYWDKTGRMELYLMDMETKKIEQVTNGELPKDIKSEYIWARDNETIVYVKDDTGSEKNDIYSFNTRTKEVLELSIDPEVQEYIADSSPDGDWYSFMSLRAGQMNIFKMRKDGSEITQLTAHENPAGGGIFSPDGSVLAYGANEEGNVQNSDIYLVDEDGGKIERVVQINNGSKEFFSKWAPDGKSFAFFTDSDGYNRPGIYNMVNKSYKLLGDRAYNENPVAFSEDSSMLYCLVNDNASIYPSMYDLSTGERTVFNFPKGIAAGGEIDKLGNIVLSLNSPSKPTQVVFFNPGNENIETLLEPELGNLDPTLFVDNDYIRYPSSLDSQIPAMVFKPKDWSPDKKYPGVIWAHGGPTAQFFNIFMAQGQYYADKGYVVMYPNVRGSTGYGAEFRDCNIKDWGGKDLDDWVAGRQYLIDNYGVDPERVAITGGSYGGYATLISVGKRPELWKVGAAAVPISNLFTLHAEDLPHFKYYIKRQMGDPIKDKELWEERSPINYADKVTAKMMLLQGENDPRCPVSQSRDYIAALQEAGKIEGEDYEYVEIKGMGHGMFTDRVSRIRDAKTMSQFIMKHL